MDSVKVGIINFCCRDKIEIVGFALFYDGQCLKYLYNDLRMQELMDQYYGNLYQVPESLTEMIAGCMEKFWDEYLAESFIGAFLKFEKIKEYSEVELKEKLASFFIELKLKQISNE